MNKPKVIVIIGPTASGKTSLAIKAAKQFDGEIISADSRAIYREMSIGTAKPERDGVCHSERSEESIRVDPSASTTPQDDDLYLVEGVVHYGFDIVEPDEHFQAFDFKEFAEAKIKDIVSQGKVPIVAGGTGLYVAGLVDNFDFEGGKAGKSKFDVLQIGIKVDREVLYDRINKRVDEMVDEGLVDEVCKLNDKYGCEIKSMTGIGYRQICEYLNGDVSLETAIENLKRDTRHYAKRQMTWFKRDDRIKWIEKVEEGIKLIKNFL